MRFLKQIGVEIRNILRSRFLLVMAILTLAISILGPVGGYIALKRSQTNNGGGVIFMKEAAVSTVAGTTNAVAVDGNYVAGDGTSPIIIGGVSIDPKNPLYWNLNSMIQERSNVETNRANYTNVETVDLLLEMFDQLIQYELIFAQNVTTYEDFRMELEWQGQDTVVDKFIYDRVGTVKEAALIEASQYRKGLDEASFRKKYLDITAAQRLEAAQKAQDMLDKINIIVTTKDFPTYVEVKRQQYETQIADLQDNIKLQEQAIIDNPAQEESLNQIIEDLKKQIKNIEENSIPILELRLEKNIVPGDGSWQNNAVTNIENNQNQLTYTTIMSEEDYKKDLGTQQQYGSYAKYKNAIQSQINRMNNEILVSKNSLNADKPDMKFVTDGARYRTASGLYFSVIVALFAVLLGGWLIASEFQQGTIRLLMIRPRTRTKILASKFLAALGLSLAIYLAGSLLGAVMNGILFGFADFGFPNYSVTGETAYLAYYLPRLLVCMVTIVFAFTVSVMLSVVVRNTAVAVAVPIVLFVGCFMATAMLSYSKAMYWLAYTPVPYVQLYSFFTPTNMYSYMADYGGAALNPLIGIAWFAVLTVGCAITSLVVFKQRDITN